MNIQMTLPVVALCLSSFSTCQAQGRAETDDWDPYPLNQMQLASSHTTFDKKDEYE